MESVSTSIPNLIEEGQVTPKIEHKTNLDAADFQKLFLEQLKHQDPLSPMNQQDMMAQLATLMELSRNNETNELLKSMNAMEGTRNRMESGALIGKHVALDTSHVQLKGGVADIKYNLPANASHVVLDVYKGTELVRSFEHTVKGLNKPEQAAEKAAIQANFLAAGVHTQPWNGQNDSRQGLPDGAYTIIVRAADEKQGMPMVSAAASMEGWVKSVHLSGNRVTYKVGNTPDAASPENTVVTAEQITQILPN